MPTDIDSHPVPGRLGRLGLACFIHRRRVLALWLAGLIALIAVATVAGSSLTDTFSGGDAPSAQAQTLLRSRFPAQAGDTADIVVRATAPLRSTSALARVDRLVAALRPLPHVVGVQNPLSKGAEHLVARDGHVAYAVVRFDATADDLPKTAVTRVVNTARGYTRPGFQVALGGAPIGSVVSASPGSSEAIGIAAAIVIMLLAFGSVVAMGLPLITALIGVGTGFGVVELLSRLLTVPSFAPEMMVMVGLGVGIDYALLIVTRYRHGLADGATPERATQLALDTAGRSALFAGATVIISLLGLFIVGLPFLQGLAAGTILAVLLVLGAALTLLPAMLGFAGRAIDRLHLPGRRPTVAAASAGGGFWQRWSQSVQHRPWLCGGAALAALLAVAVPMLSMRLGFTDAGNDPTSLTTRQAYDLLAGGFGPGVNGPLVIAGDLHDPRARATFQVLPRTLRHTPGIASATPARLNSAGDAGVIIATPTSAPQAAATAALVSRLRGDVLPAATAGSGARVLVGGETAAGVDSASYLSARMGWVIALVVVCAMVLLTVVFRSVVIPLKAAAMNLLSIGGAYGVIVAVFQWGWLGPVFGVSRPGPIDPWIPLMMFTITFGLSMDYEVFLLSRIRERWLAGVGNAEAVTDGLAITARVITAAAAIMICVFGSFVIGDPLHILNVFGLGLAAAILIDATLVRMVLVPSIMQLLGETNWWLPDWLDRRLPRMTEADTPATCPMPAPGPPTSKPTAIPSR